MLKENIPSRLIWFRAKLIPWCWCSRTNQISKHWQLPHLVSQPQQGHKLSPRMPSSKEPSRRLCSRHFFTTLRTSPSTRLMLRLRVRRQMCNPTITKPPFRINRMDNLSLSSIATWMYSLRQHSPSMLRMLSQTLSAQSLSYAKIKPFNFNRWSLLLPIWATRLL